MIDTSSPAHTSLGSTLLAPKSTALEQNPFSILGATTRDDRTRIIELERDHELADNAELCQKARATLINPRLRLSAEIAWLPGLAPSRAAQALDALRATDIYSFATDLPSLARANLLAARLEIHGSAGALALTLKDAKTAVIELANAVAAINGSEVLRDINEDRAVAGFPTVSEEAAIDEHLLGRQRYYREVLHLFLDQLETKELVNLVTAIVSVDTNNGQRHPSALIQTLISAYELGAGPFFDAEVANANVLIERIRDRAAHGELTLFSDIDTLILLLKNWRQIATPLLQANRAIGLDHPTSRQLAANIRSTAIDLYNDHAMLSAPETLFNALRHQFTELTEFLELVEHDVATLISNRDAKIRSEQQEQEFKRSITYSFKPGIFGGEFSISPDGIFWRGQTYTLDSIRNLTWGGTRHSVNGIPTGATYEIRFGTESVDVRVDLKDQSAYLKFIDCFWRAIGVRLMFEFARKLREGGSLTFQDLLIYDTHVMLFKRKPFRKSESMKLAWTDVTISSSAGNFVIQKRGDKSVSATLSYIHTYNVHVVEIMLQTFFKNDRPNLSSIID